MMKPNNVLKFARMDAGLTQEDVANRLGVSAITVYRWERGKNSPGSYFRGRLCKLLQLTEQELGFQEAGDEVWSREHSSFLVDPYFPASQAVPLGQQSQIKEIASSHHYMVGLVGLPGSGKSSIAQAVAGLPDVRQHVEGVLWASVGQEPKPLRHLQRWLMLLGWAAGLPENVEEARDRLRVMLRGQKMLIVLDDLWNAEDIIPYQLGAQCRYVVTTRLPVVVNTVCDLVFHPHALTEMQAFHLLSHDLPIALVREHREILRALCQQVGNLPLAIEQMGKYLRREARSFSQRRFQEALTHLFQSTSYLPLQISPDSCSLAASIKRSETWLSPPAQHAFSTLATHFPAAPSTFSERQVVDLIETSQQFQLHDLDQLLDSGLLSATAVNRYQMHPVIAAYARLRAKGEPEITG